MLSFTLVVRRALPQFYLHQTPENLLYVKNAAQVFGSKYINLKRNLGCLIFHLSVEKHCFH